MSHGKKSKRKKHKHPTRREHSKGDAKLNNKPDHVHVSGKIETDLPQKLIEKYDTASNKENGWNRKQFVLSIVTAILIFAYTTVAAWQGCSSEKAANAAKHSVEVANATLKVSQGAYVTIGRKDGVVAEFVVPKDPKEHAEIVVYFQNSGHLPVKFAWGIWPASFLLKGSKKQSSGIAYAHEFKGLPTRSRDIKTGSMQEQGASNTIAGDSLFAGTAATISQQDLAELPINDMGVLLQGQFEYCDELGTHSSRQFGLQYRSHAPSSSLSFSLDHDIEMPTLPLPQSTATTEYLFPCETVSEREKKTHQ
jgi:hypothetical protein